MTRDWECVRAILMALEAKPDTKGLLHPSRITGWDEEAVSYHMWILGQAGLIETKSQAHHNAPILCLAYNLTWTGHELLDKLKSEPLWNRIRLAAREKSIEISFEAITVLASKSLDLLF